MCEYTQKKNVSNYFAYVLSGIAKHHRIPKRVKAHAIRREPSTLLLYALVKFGDFERTRFSGRFNVYVCFYLSQLIGIYGFKGSTLFRFSSDFKSPRNSFSFNTRS